VIRARRRPGRAGALAVAGALLVAAATPAAFAAGTPASTGAPTAPLRVATDLPAPGFWDGDRVADGGFEATLAEALAGRLGRSGVRIVPTPFRRIVEGRFVADLALAQVTITPARARVVEFSAPYLTVDQGILTRAGGPDPRATPATRWGVERFTTGADTLRTVVRPAGPVRAYPSAPRLFAALRDGAVDAVLIDAPIAAQVAQDSGGTLTVVGRVPTGEQYGAVLRQGARDNAAVTAALGALVADGTVARLEAAAFGGPAVPPPRFVP
jgi:polar amino acid transport system substrate-binding protein